MNLYFDVSSMLISLVLIVYFGVSKKLKSYQNGLFFVMIIMNLISSIADYLKYGDHLLGMSNSYLYTMAYYFTNILVVLLMFVYVHSLGISWYSLKTGKKVLVIAPAILSSIVLLTNPITNFSFYYENNVYHRSIGLLIFYAMGVFYFAATVLVVITTRKTISFLRRMAILVGLFLIVGSVVLQFLFSEIRMETFGVSFAQLIIFFTVKNPMDHIDTETGLYNKSAFNDIMNHHELAHTFFDLVVIALPEMKAGSYLNQEKCDRILKQTADFIADNISGHVIYRILPQVLIVEFGNADEETINVFMSDICRRFKSPFDMGNFESLCRCKVMHISVPDQVKDSAEIEAAIRNLIDDKSLEEIVSVNDFNTDTLRRKIQVEKTLNNAINKESMDLIFYPVYSVDNKAFLAAESYPSYIDDEMGIIDPDEMTNYAGELVHQFKKWEDIFADTCDFLNSEKVKNSKLKALFIPYDSLTCVRTSEIKRYVEIAKEKNVDMSKLVFFVSEYVVSKAYDIIKADIEECRKLGIRFGVKDYGSGFTDIETIYGLKLDIISVSHNLVNDALFDEKAEIALESVLELAKALDMRTLLRGISDDGSAEMVKRLNCDYVMGNYYSALLDQSNFIKLINDEEAPEKGGNK